MVFVAEKGGERKEKKGRKKRRRKGRRKEREEKKRKEEKKENGEEIELLSYLLSKKCFLKPKKTKMAPPGIHKKHVTVSVVPGKNIFGMHHPPGSFCGFPRL